MIKIISVEEWKNEDITELKKELSDHLSFDNATKKVNKKIVDKEISIKKIEKKPRKTNIIIRKANVDMPEGTDETKYYARQSIAQCRMEKFLAMTAADLPTPTVKQLACLNPVLKTPKDTLRCINCDMLYNPIKKNEHLKTCPKTKLKKLFFGCAQCSFKSTDKDQVTQHIKAAHK